MLVPIAFLENAASQVPDSAHKHVYPHRYTYLCEPGIFSYMLVFLSQCCVLLLEVTLLFKNFLLNALLLLPHPLMPTLKKSDGSRRDKDVENENLCSCHRLSANLSLQFENLPSLLLKTEKCQ